jgi:hypothetical protein
MATFRYTHGINFIFRILYFLASMCVLIGIGILVQPFAESYLSQKYGEIIAIIFGLIAMFAAQHYLFRCFDDLSTFFYVRRTLKTVITYKEAKDLIILFTPNETGKWYPLSEIKALPENERKAYLFHQAEIAWKEFERDKNNQSR